MWYWHDPNDTYGMRSSRLREWFPITEGDSALGKLKPRIAYTPDMWSFPEGSDECLGDVTVDLTHRDEDDRIFDPCRVWEDSIEFDIYHGLPGR